MSPALPIAGILFGVGFIAAIVVRVILRKLDARLRIIEAQNELAMERQGLLLDALATSHACANFKEKT